MRGGGGGNSGEHEKRSVGERVEIEKRKERKIESFVFKSSHLHRLDKVLLLVSQRALGGELLALQFGWKLVDFFEREEEKRSVRV